MRARGKQWSELWRAWFSVVKKKKKYFTSFNLLTTRGANKRATQLFAISWFFTKRELQAKSRVSQIINSIICRGETRKNISRYRSFLLQLSAIVDGIYAEHGHTAGSFAHLASDRLLVGGGADARSLQGAKGINNFVGCLRKVGSISHDLFITQIVTFVTTWFLRFERKLTADTRRSNLRTVTEIVNYFQYQRFSRIKMLT